MLIVESYDFSGHTPGPVNISDYQFIDSNGFSSSVGILSGDFFYTNDRYRSENVALLHSTSGGMLSNPATIRSLRTLVSGWFNIGQFSANNGSIVITLYYNTSVGLAPESLSVMYGYSTVSGFYGYRFIDGALSSIPPLPTDTWAKFEVKRSADGTRINFDINGYTHNSTFLDPSSPITVSANLDVSASSGSDTFMYLDDISFDRDDGTVATFGRGRILVNPDGATLRDRWVFADGKD